MVAEHVHDADTRKCRCKEVRTLVDDRPDQQSAVGLTLYRQPVRARDALGLEEVSSGGEVVIGILPLLELTCCMPGPPVLAAAPDVGNGKHSPLLDPGHLDGVVV